MSVLVAVSLAACGSPGGGGPTGSQSIAEGRGAGPVTTEAVTPVDQAGPDRPGGGTWGGVGRTAEPGSDDDVRGRGMAPPYLCSRDPAAFDLSDLSLGSGTPVGFAVPWTTAKRRSKFPGLVVVYSGTATGPELTVRVGSVKKYADGIYTFTKTMPGSAITHKAYEEGDPFHVHTDHMSRDFIVSMGQVQEREGFVARDITVDGELDSMCSALRHVSVRMTVPADLNRKTRFGGVMLGAVMGPPTEDTDRDGKPDSWLVTLTGDHLKNMMFSL